MGLEYVFYEAIVLAEVETVGMGGVVGGFGRYYARRVLAAVLEDGQAVEEHLVDVVVFRGQEEGYYAAHCFWLLVWFCVLVCLWSGLNLFLL